MPVRSRWVVWKDSLVGPRHVRVVAVAEELKMLTPSPQSPQSQSQSQTQSQSPPPPYHPMTSSDMESQFAAVVAEAVRQHHHHHHAGADAERSGLDEFLNPPIRSLADLTQHLSLQNKDFAHFREKRQHIFDALALALEPVQIVGEMVSGASEDAFAPVHYIFGAVSMLIKAAHDVSSTYDTIIELFVKLKDFTSRLDVYIKHAMTPALRDKVVAILAVLFEVIVISIQAARQGRVKAYFKRLLFLESPAHSALKKLDALTLSEQRQVMAETYHGVAQINDKADRVQDMVSQVSQSIQEMKLEGRMRKTITHRDKLKDILEPSPFAEDYYTAFTKSRIQGTGNWLLEDEGFHAWIQGETNYLWICGNPGTGKSFLTSRLITWGIEQLPQLAYFFFRDNDPETRSVLQGLRDVADQLTETDAYYAEKLMRDLHSSDDIKTVASAYRRLFIQPFVDDTRDRSLIYILLDGIDEADQGEIHEFLSLLAPDSDSDGIAMSESRLRFCLIGRTYMTDTVAASLDPDSSGQVFTTIHVTQTRSAADVLAFIKDGVRHSRILSRSTDKFKKEVVEAMDKQVDGLFILAKFMMTEVNRKRHPSSILKSLESFPKEIDGMLVEAMTDLTANISDEEIRDLNEMLSWVACAEESLTLAQLEAALVLVFGDSPLGLEEALRGQYSCFFELERADGLTTDDLIKEYAKMHREEKSEKSEGTSPAAGTPRSPRRALTSSNANSPSPIRHVSPSPHRSVSPAFGSPSSGRRYSPSPGPSPSVPDLSIEMDFRSPSNTKVTFPHTSIKQFFRLGLSHNLPSNSTRATIGFDIVAARVHIVRVCLRIFTDKAWFEKQRLGNGRQAMKQYAAWYWQEHLTVLDPAIVPADDRRELAMQIYDMLTDDDILYDWSVMYEKNDEGLEVLTDANIAGLRTWLHDPVVYESLSPEAQQFASNATDGSLGICEPIGRFYAKAWLSEDCRQYVPTLFCFNIVQNMALMDAGHAWSEAGAASKDAPIQDRMAKATEWANYPKTSYWHMRVGSTNLMLGMYGTALHHYNEALDLRPDDVEIRGRMAFCLSKYGRYNEALGQALQCALMEEKRLREDGAEKLRGHALRSCKWRLYKDYLLIGRCYHRIGEVDSSQEYYQRAVDRAADADLDANEYLEAETEYIGMLAAENMDQELMTLLTVMAMALQAPSTNKPSSCNSRLTDLFLHHSSKPLVMDWIPKVACKSGRADFVFVQLELAIDAAQRARDPTAVLYLRIAYGSACFYNRDTDGAIELFEKISLEGYKPRGNIPTRQGYALAFQRLAHIYKCKVLQFDINSAVAHAWIGKMEVIQAKQNEHQNLDMPPNMLGSDVNVASIYLASLYTALGRDLEANTLLRKLVLSNLDILLDDEPRNDGFALENLLRAFLAANDVPNALALAQSMRKVNPRAFLPSPKESPMHTRIEPKLPDIQSSNRTCSQCLDNIFAWADFVLCRYCLDSYCLKCLDGVIRGPGNTTSDGRADVFCRSDHEWFTVPPLNKVLHRGEILWEDGQVKAFTEWENGLRRRWGGMQHEESQTSAASFWLT